MDPMANIRSAGEPTAPTPCPWAHLATWLAPFQRWHRVNPVLNTSRSLTMHLKPEERKYDNKYAQQLAADYQSLCLGLITASKCGSRR